VAFQLADDGAFHGILHNIPGFGLTACAFAVILIAILVAGDVLSRNIAGTTRIMQMPLVLRWAGYYALILVILFCWNAASSQFIYFTF
jgi:hypothetical protein